MKTNAPISTCAGKTKKKKKKLSSKLWRGEGKKKTEVHRPNLVKNARNGK